MYFHVIYDAVGHNSLVSAVRFQDLLQQLEFLLIYIILVIVGPYTFEGRIHSHRRTSKHH